jgi:hypothetical protein
MFNRHGAPSIRCTSTEDIGRSKSAIGSANSNRLSSGYQVETDARFRV